MTTENPPILIVGAGPTGLTLANLLARMDIPFFLIDKKSHPSRNSKAIGIQARSLEIFDQLGIAKKAVEEGHSDISIHLIIKGKKIANFSIQETLPGETNYPFLLLLQQDKTEELLIQALKKQDGKVHWEQELLELHDHEDGKTAVIKESSGMLTERRFQYVIGCDGAGSKVRETAGFSFKGKTFSNTFYLADCEMDWDFSHGDVFFNLSPFHVSGIFPFPEKNKYRVFNFMNTTVTKGEGAELSFEDVQKLFADNSYVGMMLKKVEWASVFKIHSRFTTNFQKGRVFLAGDAAHVHTPAGGQGMNTGIQDAYNLAWKLSLVITGKANSSLLQTYHEERFPIAQNLHNTTDRLFWLMVQENKKADYFRLKILPKLFRLLSGLKRLRKRNLMRISQLAIKYRFSSLSKEGSENNFNRKAPEAGDRAPYCRVNLHGKVVDIFKLFSCTNFTLIIAVSDANSLPEKEWFRNLKQEINLPITIFVIQKKSKESAFFKIYGVKKNAVFIIRPDGHIGYRSSKIKEEEARQYLEEVQ